MLDAYIIDQIRRRDEERRREEERPAIQIPLPPLGPLKEKPRDPDEEESPRGVIIIDL